MAVSEKLSGTRTSARTIGRRRRHIRVRKKVSGTPARPRLVVTRSTRHVFVQVVDDVAGRTLASASTMEADVRSSSDDKTAKAMDTGGGTERREGGHIPGMHRTPSLDYAICLEGDRVLLLEDSEVVLNKGDVVIQCGNWHSWGAKSDVPTIMSYVMIGGEFG